MATTFDAAVFDSLSDNVLKSMRFFVLLVRANGEIDVDLLHSLIENLNGYPFGDFCNEVEEAYERRYGPVPGCCC